MPHSRRILVIGGTGAQGFAVVQALLDSCFSVRVLSRNPHAEYVRAKFADYPQVEFAQGSFLDFKAVARALEDCYGVYVNTDSYTVNEKDELWAGVRIFEIANTIPSLKHFVYGAIDYYLRLTNFNPKYAAHHTNGKGRVSAFLQSQPSEKLAWTVINTGVYNEDILGGPLMPQMGRDGTVKFRLPLGEPSGHVPFATLQDTGIFAAIVFQSPERWSGQTLNTASHFSTGPEIAEAFVKTTGRKALYENVSLQEWEETSLGEFARAPVASTDPEGITIAENFRMWWPGFQDSVLFKKDTRDFKLLREIHPDIETMEGWMSRVGYDGTAKGVLKGWIDAGFGHKE